MIQTVTAWLPEEALHDGRIESAMSKVVADWSRDWLAGSAASLTQVEPEVRGGGSRHRLWSDANQQVQARADRPVRLSTAAQLLSCKLAEMDLSEADAAFLEPLFNTAICDLLGRIESHLLGKTERTAIARSDAGLITDGLSFEIECAPHCGCIRLQLNRDFAVRARRRLAGPGRAARPLGVLEDAIAGQPVRIGARLGAVQITVRDLADLAPGDVLTLDREIDDALEMIIDTSVRQEQLCKIQAADASLELRLVDGKG